MIQSLMRGGLPFFVRTQSRFAEMNGWARVITGPVEVHDVPGTHMGIFFEPHVGELVGRLAASMEKGRQESGFLVARILHEFSFYVQSFSRAARVR